MSRRWAWSSLGGALGGGQVAGWDGGLRVTGKWAVVDVYKPTRLDPLTGERLKGKYWYVRYRDAEGRVREVRGLRGRAATMLMALELERGIAPGKSGRVEPAGRRSLRAHIEDFGRALAAGRATAKQVTGTLRLLRAVLDGCGFFGPTEIDASRLIAWLRQQRKAGNLSPADTADHLRAVKEFTAWLVQDRRTATDPMVRL